MIQIVPQMRILVAVEPVDFRRGIDGLAKVCRDNLNLDPFSGAVVVFRNRRGTSIKLLTYDGQGYWCMQKRLSAGRFRFWPQSATGLSRQLETYQLQVLLSAGNPEATQAVPMWRRIRAPA